MIFRTGTTRLLFAFYLAVCLPLCCCHLPSADACSDQHEGTLTWAPDTHVHDTSHHDLNHQHYYGDQVPAEDQTPSPECPSDHDESCDCGCDAGKSLLIEKTITINCPALVGATINWTAPVFTIDRLGVRHLAINRAGAPRLLMRMHCALII